MRIALSGWFWGAPETGSGQYLRHLIEPLVDLRPGARFVLLLPPDGLYASTSQSSYPLPAAVSPKVVPVPRALAGTALAKVYWEQVGVPRALRRLDVDMLHVPYWAPPLLGDVPTVVTVHDLIPLLLPAYRGSFAVRLYTTLVRLATLRADFVLADSEASRRDIIRYLRVSSERVRRVWLAVDSAYQPESHDDDVVHLQTLGLSPGYLLYLGGFDRRKNLAVIFQTLARLREVVKGVSLVVAGKLPQRDTYLVPDPQRLLEKTALAAEAVRFIGFVPEAAKPALYRGARAFLFPSRYEGFGLPPLEALACGVPVVGSQVSSLPEVIGDAGVLLDPDDVEGMADALVRLLEDDAFYATLHARARRQVARFSWEATARATWEAYGTVLG